MDIPNQALEIERLKRLNLLEMWLALQEEVKRLKQENDCLRQVLAMYRAEDSQIIGRSTGQPVTNRLPD